MTRLIAQNYVHNKIKDNDKHCQQRRIDNIALRFCLQMDPNMLTTLPFRTRIRLQKMRHPAKIIRIEMLHILLSVTVTTSKTMTVR